MINENAQKLGEYIKKLRKDKKISAKELAGYVGYSQSYLSAIENNNNNNVPSKKVLNRIAEALWHIGYDSVEVKNQLYTIAGYKIDSEIMDDKFFISYNNEIGAYDNLSDKVLEKPYLDLNYLLENDFALKYNYKNNGIVFHVDLEKKHKKLINEIIKNILDYEDIEETYNSMMVEYQEINEKNH